MGLVIVAFDLGDANMQSGSLLWLTEALNHTHCLYKSMLPTLGYLV